MDEFSFLKKHPFFIKQDKNQFFFDDKSNCRFYIITITDTFHSHIDFPVLWETSDMEDFQIWSAPKWFRDIHFQTNDKYFKTHRLRYLTSGIKRDIINILYFSFLEEEDGEAFFNLFPERVDVDSVIRFPLNFLPHILKLKDCLKNENYEAIIKEENHEICFMIK